MNIHMHNWLCMHVNVCFWDCRQISNLIWFEIKLSFLHFVSTKKFCELLWTINYLPQKLVNITLCWIVNHITNFSLVRSNPFKADVFCYRRVCRFSFKNSANYALFLRSSHLSKEIVMPRQICGKSYYATTELQTMIFYLISDA